MFRKRHLQPVVLTVHLQLGLAGAPISVYAMKLLEGSCQEALQIEKTSYIMKILEEGDSEVKELH